jgi:hypothetical protein
MSRKDFNLIAEVIKAMNLDAETRRYVAEQFAARLSTTNARFDEFRFIMACTPGRNV